LCGHLFYEHPYRLSTVYAHVYADNDRSLQPLLKGGMCVEEVVLSSNGKQKARLSLRRDTMSERARKLIHYAVGST
jgi:hypothetical protein